MTAGNSKRRTKFWKQPIINYVDEEEIVKTNSSSSVENSRRESMSSGQGSPIKSSPKKSKDQKAKKSPSSQNSADDATSSSSTNRRANRRNSKDRNESPRDENRLSAGARLYRVMEEQSLGEHSGESNENLYPEGSRRMSLCSPGSSPNFWY